jgi:hypothetical protein
MKSRIAVPVIIGALLLASGVGIGLWFVGDGFRTRTLTGVTSTGSAVIEATADTAVWSLTLTARDTTAADAAKRVAGALPKVRAYFVNAGLSEAQFTVGSLNSWSASENGLQFTEASLSFTVRSKTVQQIADLNAKVMDLLAIAPNVNINTSPPSYYISTLDELRPQVQEAAVKDAKQRAEVMAKALNVSLGKPIIIRSSSITVTPPDVIEGEAGGYDLSTIEKRVRAVVSVSFEVGD